MSRRYQSAYPLCQRAKTPLIWQNPLRQWSYHCLPPGGRGTTKWWKEHAGEKVKHGALRGTIVYLSLPVTGECSPHPPLCRPLSPPGKAMIVDFRLALTDCLANGRGGAMPFATNGIAPPAFSCKMTIASICSDIMADLQPLHSEIDFQSTAFVLSQPLRRALLSSNIREEQAPPLPANWLCPTLSVSRSMRIVYLNSASVASICAHRRLSDRLPWAKGAVAKGD